MNIFDRQPIDRRQERTAAMVRRSLDRVGMERGCRVKFVRVADELVVVKIANDTATKVRSIKWDEPNLPRPQSTQRRERSHEQPQQRGVEK
jgi:hypothetical protein